MCESNSSSSDNDSGSNDNGGNATVTPAAPAPAPAPAAQAAPKKEAITGIAAGEIGVDEDGKSYRVVDKGGYTARDYSVDTPASAAPASAAPTSASSGNSLYQTIANVLTPGDGMEYVDGVLVDTPTVPGGRRLDADNLAGSNYAPTANAGTADAVQDYTPPEQGSNDFGQNVANLLTPNDGTTYVNGVLMGDYQGPNIDGSAGYNATGSGLNDQAFTMSTNPLFPNNSTITDAGTTITSPNGTVTTLADQQENFTDPNFNTDAPGLIQTVEQDGTFVRDPNQQTNTVTQDTDSGPTQAEIDAAAEKAAEEERQRLAALRQSAIDGAMGRLSDAFGFATDDYFTGLGTNYQEGGLSPAFTTAYDDAVRGMYDVYKSAGMLNQADVDDDLNLLSSSQGGEQARLDNIVSNYVTANREYVDSGRNTIADQIRALGTVDEINNFDVVSAAQPYRQPTEQSVVDFFTDFAKRSYDPSYNVDPSAVSSGGPRRVSGSVDQLGTNTQPSTVAGIFDPLAGSSARVVA